MRKFRKKSFIKQWVSYLSLLLLLQGLFPVQTHSVLVRGENGRLVEVCTLEGVRTVVVNENGKQVDHRQTDTERSAAMVFSLLMASAIPGVTAPAIALASQSADHIPYARVESVQEFISGLKPIRAPPVYLVS